MLDCEARTAWQLYLCNWIPLGGIVLLLALCLALSEFSLKIESPRRISSSPAILVQLQELPRVRDGSLRILETSTLGGIITFPSFHAAAAALGYGGCGAYGGCGPLH